MKRWDLEYRGNPYSEHREMVPSDEYGEWVTFDDADAEIRRLRAMVLRAHGYRAWDGWFDRHVNHSRRHRAARLLNHYAALIEAGRL